MSGVGVSGLDLETLLAPLAGYNTIGLAVSGGPDSLAMMLLLAAWGQAPGRPLLRVYTVDHGLRPEAADEAAMVVREATRLGLEARILTWRGDKPDSGVQAAARTARYRLLAAARRDDDLDVVVTAHHLADQAETVWMRLAHGSGIHGLAGMRALSFVEGCPIARPLLGVDPGVLRAVVAAAGLTAAHDPGNVDPHYERVRWRQFQPELDRMGLNISRMGVLARRMDDAAALIDSAMDAAWPQLVTPVSEARFEIAQDGFAALNPLVGVALLGQVLQLVAGDRRAPPLGPLESLHLSLRDGETRATTLHGCVIAARGNVIGIDRERPRTAALKAEARAGQPMLIPD